LPGGMGGGYFMFGRKSTGMAAPAFREWARRFSGFDGCYGPFPECRGAPGVK
jgi:hypothetical protein